MCNGGEEGGHRARGAPALECWHRMRNGTRGMLPAAIPAVPDGHLLVDREESENDRPTIECATATMRQTRVA